MSPQIGWARIALRSFLICWIAFFALAFLVGIGVSIVSYYWGNTKRVEYFETTVIMLLLLLAGVVVHRFMPRTNKQKENAKQRDR